MKIIFYNTNGIISDTPSNSSFWIQELGGQFSLKEGNNSTELNFALIALHYKIADLLLGDRNELMTKILPLKPIWIGEAGIDTESGISKQFFEKLLTKNNDEETHKLLYYYDVGNLIDSLVNLIFESKHIFCEFYRLLNIKDFSIGEPFNPDSVMMGSGGITTNIFSTINHIFINLASQLDFITKIAIEVENIPIDFKTYPKMKSKNILYGDAKRIKTIDLVDTLFEETDNARLIISLRNEIIHNSALQKHSKVYQAYKDGKLIEKFIHIPDSTSGNIDSYKNRNRFFSQGIKLNEILPELIIDFWRKMQITVTKIDALL